MTVASPLASRSSVLEALQRPIDPRHFKTRRQGSKELTYVPWSTLVRCLQSRTPGYSWELKAVAQVGDWVTVTVPGVNYVSARLSNRRRTVTGRLSIPTADGPLVYENVSSEPLKSASQAPPVETAASSCLRRCCAMAGLGLQLWELD